MYINVLDSNVKCGDNRHKADNSSQVLYKKYRENTHIIKNNDLQKVFKVLFFT